MFLKNNLIKLLIITVSLINLIKCDTEQFKTIEIESGLIRGKVLRSFYSNNEYFAFRGIPYAKPPVNDLRFEVAQKPEPWKNVLDTLKTGNMCVQYNRSKILVGDEDCLFLNVYTPSLSRNLPVMFYIFGGRYKAGSADEMKYGPDFLVDENVIVVNINYRLGVLGFMSLGTEQYPGNIGLRDQIHALKWVNANIHSFGGDNKRITIFGHSAGSASTQFLSLSPLTKNLFQRVISQSGGILNKWAYHYESEHNRDFMLELFFPGKEMGQTSKNITELVSFLKSIDKMKLYENLKHEAIAEIEVKEESVIFKPIIENKKWPNAFITETPEVILKNQRHEVIDTMMGYTSNEDLQATWDIDLFDIFNERFKIELPLKEANFSFESKEYQSIIWKIRKFYLGESGMFNKEKVYEYVDMCSDVFFRYAIDRTVKYLSKRANVYYYKFSVAGNLNYFKVTQNLTMFEGAEHGGEICYIFKCNALGDAYGSLSEESIERKSIKNMVKLWSNFAKYGNPTHDGFDFDWKPIKNDTINFIDIRNDGLITALNPYEKAFKFWNDLFKDY